MGAVEVEQRAEVDVGDAVGVGRAEALAAEPLGRAAAIRPPVGVSSAGVDALDLDPVGPALGRGELLDHLAQVAGASRKRSKPCAA